DRQLLRMSLVEPVSGVAKNAKRVRTRGRTVQPNRAQHAGSAPSNEPGSPQLDIATGRAPWSTMPTIRAPGMMEKGEAPSALMRERSRPASRDSPCLGRCARATAHLCPHRSSSHCPESRRDCLGRAGPTHHTREPEEEAAVHHHNKVAVAEEEAAAVGPARPPEERGRP